jgi:hypothetical protein
MLDMRWLSSCNLLHAVLRERRSASALPYPSLPYLCPSLRLGHCQAASQATGQPIWDESRDFQGWWWGHWVDRKGTAAATSSSPTRGHPERLGGPPPQSEGSEDRGVNKL